MQSTDVKSVYHNSRSNPTTKHKLIDLDSSGSCRVFSVVWCPYQMGKSDSATIELWEGDPDSGGVKKYEDGFSNGAGADAGQGPTDQPFIIFSPSPSHYYLFNNAVYVKGSSGTGSGLGNVTVTYQMGG